MLTTGGRRARSLAIAVTICVLGGLLSTVPVGADDLTEAQRNLEIIKRVKGDLQSNLEKAQGQQVALEQELKQTQDMISRTVEQIQKTEAKLRVLDQQIADLVVKIAQTQADLKRKKAALADFLRGSYKRNDNTLSLLGAQNFTEFLSRAATLQHVSFVGQVMIERIRQEELRLQRQQEELKVKRAQAEKERAVLVAQREQLERLQEREQEVLADLKRSIARVEYQLKTVDGQSAELAQRIAQLEIERQNRIIAEAQALAWQQAQLWMSEHLREFPDFGGGRHSTKYPLVWGEQVGQLTLGFGPCSYAFEPPAFGYPHFHTGIDVAAPAGTAIHASDDGVVIGASQSKIGDQLVGYGNYVIIAHKNNFATLYAHLTAYVVKTGDTVRQNQVIGTEGSTGNSTGPHLHFEYRYNGVPTNPAPYLPPDGPNAFDQ